MIHSGAHKPLRRSSTEKIASTSDAAGFLPSNRRTACLFTTNKVLLKITPMRKDQSEPH